MINKLTLSQLHYIILFFGVSAVLGSLYYQNFGDPVSNLMTGKLFPPNNGYNPCTLCWWQRIWMYPIPVIAVIALVNKDRNFSWYTGVLASIGVTVASYHYYIQKVRVPGSLSCSLDNPCSASEVNYLGFITIPFLAMTAFGAIAVASYLHIQKNRLQK